MKKVIAVENNLTPVKEFLKLQGCQVIDVESALKTEVDAVVLSGVKQNLMGMQDIMINAPVITASGKSPQEIWDNIQQY
ncbi:MAG TPA: hypothetical protein DD811_02690 [Syntrophomonas sp.]|jgi:hypothetical protein|nr:hypothetical protein [Syntrophomonas sp.]